MGLGTGENALHPEFLEVVRYISGRGIRLSMASNGYSLLAMPDEDMKRFHDVEVSIDFATEREQDAFRGVGNWRDVHRAIDRCRKLGVQVSILATMMSNNYVQMDKLAALARSQELNLRVNVYQPVQNDRFTLSYEQFWEGFRRLLGSAKLVSCTEPVVGAVLGLEASCVCGVESVRITPRRHVTPCVYWPEGTLTIDDLCLLGEGILDTPEFRQAAEVPPLASDCPCRGGCAGRRRLLGDLNQHDPYCPWCRGDEVCLDHEWAPARALVRARNYCTTIVA